MYIMLACLPTDSAEEAIRPYPLVPITNATAATIILPSNEIDVCIVTSFTNPSWDFFIFREKLSQKDGNTRQK